MRESHLRLFQRVFKEMRKFKIYRLLWQMKVATVKLSINSKFRGLRNGDILQKQSNGNVKKNHQTKFCFIEISQILVPEGP